MIIDNEILSEVSQWMRAGIPREQIIEQLERKSYSKEEIFNVFEQLQAETTPFCADFATVANRVLHKNFKKLTSDETQLYIYDNFLAPDFCSYLCDVIRSRAADSSNNFSESDEESKGYYSHPFTDDLFDLDNNITDLFETFAKLPRVSSEFTYGCCTYKPGGISPRFGFFSPSELLDAGRVEYGGQRTWSIHAFLNEDVVGGDLVFPELKLELAPKTGSVVLWNNLAATGKPNKKTLHGEASVDQGMKFYLSKSYRLYFTP